MPRIVIAAGGTAGHVVPALAIADELRASGAEVSFIGTRERVESELVPAAGYEISFLKVAGLDRRRPDRAVLALGRAVAGVPKAMRLLGAIRPDAVLGAGGYVAGPVGFAAVLRRTPLVLSEADSRLGLSNRMLAPFARRVCLAFPIEGRSGERYLLTGRPIPKEVVEADRRAARERLGIEGEAPCVLVFGGSLGARSINDAALEAFAAAPLSVNGEEAVVLHIAGRRDYGQLTSQLTEPAERGSYRLLEWIEGTLGDVLAAADLVVARAGGSVFEVAASGTAAVLIPYPHATGDHQTTNARWFADAGAAAVLGDSELTADRLRNLVGELLSDRQRLSAMAAAARGLARPDAAARVAGELLEAAGEGRSEAPAGHAAGAVLRPAATIADAGEQPWRGRRLHFVGIGGAGMSGLALVARELGAEVSGCDRAVSVYTDSLVSAGMTPAIGHSADHVTEGVELVVSTAIPTDSPELEAARKLDVPIIHRGELLGEVSALRRLIAVTGTHGKTTTAAMVSHCLRDCGLDPSFLIGAELGSGAASAPTNAHWGDGPWLVAEADESDRSFLALSPDVAVVTNVELDHHTTYGSVIELEDAFRSFLARLPTDGAAILWNRGAAGSLVGDREAITFDVAEPDPNGTGESHFRQADFVARNVLQSGLQTQFELVRDGRPVGTFELSVPGRHNVLNGLAAIAACTVAGCDLEQAARSLASFRAAGRRFELRGEKGGVRVFDDYAHHPTEVRATLEAARALEPKRLVAVFQPHLYSRTLHLHQDLGRELAAADVVVVLDVYAARERPEGELARVTGKLVADACADRAGGRPVWWLPTLEEAQAVLSGTLGEGDVVVTLGAGDVDQLAGRLVAGLESS
jgi:UDP-N-acetylmuramate--alanine ligase